VNVAEHAHDARAPEVHRPGSSGRIQSNIKELTVEVRKGIVEDRIRIGKIDCASRSDDKGVRVKHLVFLQ
jgi:hypothetical protein